MTMQNFRFDIDADGIGLLTWDMAGRSMNVITVGVMNELDAVIDKVANDAAVKGCVITSAKDTFSGGADITMLDGLGKAYRDLARTKGEEEAMRVFFEESRRLTLIFRKLETSGKPWVAAINGMCLGGAFELSLSCHRRVASENPKTRVGLPEVKIGIFPGAGGTQRVARMIPTGDALQMLLKGDQLRLDRAKAMKLVDDVVPADKLIETAKAWIKAGQWPKDKKGRIAQPWDAEGYKLPSNKVYSAQGMMIWPPANALYRRETFDNYPGARAILQSVYEGLQVPMDAGLRIESRWFANVLRTNEAQAMIRSLFVSMQDLNKGARRPANVPPTKLKKVAVIGAGFMGAGIAYVSAQAGLDVVLLDRDAEAAEKGKAYSHKLVTDQINKGRAKTTDRDALLAKITATADYALLKDCDLVIEAVFEDRKVKEGVIKQAEAAMGKGIVFASNTSTLPITSLADYSVRPEDFVGVHFFSPVDKMMLVEVILGKKTGDKALAVALDYVRAIRKTPIVVNDSRGFFANRCVTNYVREGHLMLMEGVPPAMIETVAKMAGMPVGPLSLNDEVAIDLAWKILQATKADLGADAIDKRQETLLDIMVNKQGRLGRKNGKGFYDYPQAGPKTLWPGLADLAPKKLDPDSIDTTELKQRFLVVQALEAARTVEDGVVTDPREADVGSILGFGFAPFTGGTLSYIDFMGTKAFVELCQKLERKHGARFAPNKLLLDMAKTGDTFYGRFPPGGAKKAA